MNSIPIVEHLRANPTRELCKRVDQLAAALGEERPELKLADPFRHLVPDRLDDGPAFHIDDISEIPRLDAGKDIRFYQDRARLRAGDNDVIASCGDVVEGYEEYCRNFLGIGSPQWLRPKPARVPLRIAEACWEDADVRASLIAKLRHGDLQYMHPNMGTPAAWEVALLLQRETGRPLKMIAPPPGITVWVNNKIAFAATVKRLLGPTFVPRTESAWNFAMVAQRVKELAQECRVIGLKLPNSGGGDGNLVLDAEPFRGQSLSAIRETLKHTLQAIDWSGHSQLLIDSWETDVVSSPSAQLWIPPEQDGLPVVEGIFVQTIEGARGMFVGCVPARFSSGLTQEIADDCWLIARLFQRLGYIGRCSFDMILVGKSLDECRVEFVECNGRWGGTSLPMTLMNRIFGDWYEQPYSVQVFHDISGLDQVSFEELMRFLGNDLFDVRTGHGSIILYNPGRLRYQCGISAILLDSRWEDGTKNVQRNLSERLRQLGADRLRSEANETALQASNLKPMDRTCIDG